MVINLVLAKLNSCCQPYEAIVKVVELKEKKIKKKKKVEELGQGCSSKCKVTVTKVVSSVELYTQETKRPMPVPVEGERGTNQGNAGS